MQYEFFVCFKEVEFILVYCLLPRMVTEVCDYLAF